MTTKRISDEYLDWLTKHVSVQYGIRNDKTYDELLRIMYNKEFVWIILNDDNRVVDGIDVRREFLDSGTSRLKAGEVENGASFLEVVIGLSKRLAFDADGEPESWAWQLIDNLGLINMSDPLTEDDRDKIDGVMDTVIWRRYRRDGWGGFFPLIHTPNDQRAVELWYQMMEYINEM